MRSTRRAPDGRHRPRRLRPLRALQVEVTSRCTRSCRICPRTALVQRWFDGDLNSNLWQQLAPDLELAQHVHLQGWGEPLLHPELPAMVRQARAAGCSVGITTNGDLLDRAVDWIVEAEVDLVTVSVAGMDGTHAHLRDGSHLAAVWAAVAALARRRRRKRWPRVQISYLLTCSNAAQLPAVVHAASGAGADELFVTHLDCTVSPELLGEAAFTPAGLRASVADNLTAAESAARRSGIAFRGPALHVEELLVCALNPLRFAFLGWDGRVGPCVNLLLPVAGAIERHTAGGRVAVAPMCYGQLSDASLKAILQNETYRKFTASFAARLRAEQQFLDKVGNGWGAQALHHIDGWDQQRSRELAASPLPAECAGCHKAMGW